MTPVHWVLTKLLRRVFVPQSVLHISYMVHVPWHAVSLLRRQGVVADYLAVGESPYWNKSDYLFCRSPWPVLRVFHETWVFWSLVARYEIIHAHFMFGISENGWEWPVLKRMGRYVVVHWRGCEARNRVMNLRLHPRGNICEDCDYHPRTCETPATRMRQDAAHRWGDLALATTPDLRDFQPDAIHFPFFSPDIDRLPAPSGPHWPQRERFKLVHVTVHPGIEGSHRIAAAVDRLQAKGYAIDFVFVGNVSHAEVLSALVDADMAIGKMKMGYYANAQIESMCLGVPTITSVRSEFMTDALRHSGLIFATFDTLESVLEKYMEDPSALLEKRRQARASIQSLHNNERLTAELVTHYRRLTHGVEVAALEATHSLGNRSC